MTFQVTWFDESWLKLLYAECRIHASVSWLLSLVQIMARRLTGTKSMIWTITGILLIGPSGTNKLNWNLNRNSWIFIRENTIENVVWEIMAILSRHQCVKIAIILPPRNKRRTPIVWVILRLHSWITLEFWNYKQVLRGLCARIKYLGHK